MSHRLSMVLAAALLVAAALGTVGSAVADPYAYWPLDEGAGSVAYDATPNHNDGAISGATWTTGYAGSALYFHGGGQWYNGDGVTVPHAPSIDITGPFQIEARIRAIGSDSYNVIVDKYEYAGGVEYGYTFYLTDGKLRFSVYSGADGSRGVMGAIDLRDDAWHHVAGVWDGSHLALYVDEQPEADSEWAFPPASTSNDLCIGKRLSGWGGYMPFLGTIDEVYISPYQNEPPVCAVTWDPPVPAVSVPVTFDSNASDPDGGMVTCSWDFGDGGTAGECTTTHTYAAAGDYPVAVTVTDDEGGTVTCTAMVSIVAAAIPVPDLLEPIDPAWVDNRPPLHGLVTLSCTEATGRTSVTDPSGNGDIARVIFEYGPPDGGGPWELIGVDEDGMVETEGQAGESGYRYDCWRVLWDVEALELLPEGDYAVRATMEDIHGQAGRDSFTDWTDPTPPQPVLVSPVESAPYTTFAEGSQITLSCYTNDNDVVGVQWAWQAKQDRYIKGVPELDQLDYGYTGTCPYCHGPCQNDGSYFCAPTAWASCLLWWDQHGFPNLVPTGMTNAQLVEGLAYQMLTDCGSGPSPGTSVDNQIKGARQWIASHGGGLHVTGPTNPVTPYRFRNEIENCKEDVLFSIVYSQGGRHRVTGDSFTNRPLLNPLAWDFDYMDPGNTDQFGSHYIDDTFFLDPTGQQWQVNGGDTSRPGPHTTADMITVSPDVPLQPWYQICNAITFPGLPPGQILSRTWDLNDPTTWQDANTPMTGSKNGVGGLYLLRCKMTDSPFRHLAETIVIEITDVTPTCDIVFGPRDANDGKVWVHSPISFASNAWDAGNPGQVALDCQWDFGDGATGSGCNTTHSFASPGTYQVTLTVTDDEGSQCTDVQNVTAKVFQFPTLVEVGGGWNIVTLPCVHSDPWEVFDELRPPNKPVDLLSGCLHRYDHDQQRYATYYEWAPSDFGPLRAGDAYWLYTFEEELIGYDGDWSGGEEQVQFTTPGWYLIGSPQPFDTHLESTMWWQGPTGPMPFSGAMDIWVQDPLIGYSSLESRYVSVGLKGTDEDEYLRAFQGYWVYAFEPDLTIVLPPPP